MTRLISRAPVRRLTRLALLLGGLLAVGSAATAAADAPEALIKQGEYVATAGDCVACHSAAGGKPFAGGLAIDTPLGTIFSSNITPSKSHGIGDYSYAQFERAVRGGVRADGAHLYPAMPYTAYAGISDEDMHALYAYFMQGVAPVDQAAPATALPFPFNIRLSMAAWNLLFLDTRPYTPDAAASAEVNRGAYLAETLTHCSTCHTPRNALMAEEKGSNLAGSSLGTWFAPNITSDAQSGIGAWQVDELAHYLKTGFAPGKAQAAGPMAEAIDHSLSHLSDADRHAIAVWLKQTPPVHEAQDSRAAHQWGEAAANVDQLRGAARPANPDALSGPQLYDAYCASCHQPDGRGTPDGGLPSLMHNTALGRNNSDNLVMAILRGVQREPAAQAVNMPAFAPLLSDTQVATLSNYLLTQFGNPQPQVSLERVTALRAGGAPSPLLAVARYGMAAGGIVVLLLLLWGWRRRQR